MLLIAAASNDAHAQAAWVGEQGSLDVGLDYNLGSSSKVLTGGDTPDFPDAGTTSHQITLGVEYVPIEKLAVDVGLPMSFLKYTGNQTAYPHPAGGTYDDGDMHATLTDLRIGARYAVLEEPVAIAPHIGVSIPVADYETVGNTVAGRHLIAAHVGLGIGKTFGMAYTQLVYELSIPQKYDEVADTKKYSQLYSDLTFALGYKLLEGKLDLNLGLNFRQHHDGLDFDEITMWTPDELAYHDPVLKEQMLLLGGGIGYDITDKLSVSLAARAFVKGQNTQNASVFGLGLAWRAL
ncbi:MAG TPA: hypothetical protein VFQ53_40765 [Kofleriaceae bacterium]|nr:hypothetical protein [Kofleriaceae bacterium]